MARRYLGYESPIAVGKVLRAQRHAEEFKAAQGRYFADQPYRLSQQLHPEGPYKVFRGWVVKWPPEELSLILGDIMQDLRAALDHLAWALSVNVPKSAESKIYFPVYECREAYERRTKGGRPDPRSGLFKVQYMSARAREIIETLQPYRRGDDRALHPLWTINELARIDRHQSLNILGMFNQGEVRIERRPKGEYDHRYVPIEQVLPLLARERAFPPPHVSGTVVGMVPFDPDPEMDVYLDASFDVAFAPDPPGYGRFVLPTVAECARYVITDVLTPLLPLVFDPMRGGVVYGVDPDAFNLEWPPLPGRQSDAP
jgi:hypothetical protein